jgi:large subunit ribosomal protein L28
MAMANVCEITGKRRMSGNTVSHANNKHRTVQHPNIHAQSFLIPELKTRVRIKVSHAGLRLIDKRGGLSNLVRSTPAEALSPALRKLRRALVKKRPTASGSTPKPKQTT